VVVESGLEMVLDFGKYVDGPVHESLVGKAIQKWFFFANHIGHQILSLKVPLNTVIEQKQLVIFLEITSATKSVRSHQPQFFYSTYKHISQHILLLSVLPTVIIFTYDVETASANQVVILLYSTVYM
jgi:hypothetical protein